MRYVRVYTNFYLLDFLIKIAFVLNPVHYMILDLANSFHFELFHFLYKYIRQIFLVSKDAQLLKNILLFKNEIKNLFFLEVIESLRPYDDESFVTTFSDCV